jgi:hypothetical protein
VPLSGYGLLIGRITASRPPRGTDPHWLLMVQPQDDGHPAYRVGVNVPAGQAQQSSEFDYQIVDFGGARVAAAGSALIKKLENLGATKSFLSADADPSLPRLDFVRSGMINPAKFNKIV